MADMTTALIATSLLGFAAPQLTPASVVIFTGPNCHHCKRMVPVAEVLARKGHTVRWADIHRYRKAVQRYGVTYIPVVAITANRTVWYLEQGYHSVGDIETALNYVQTRRLVRWQRGYRP